MEWFGVNETVFLPLGEKQPLHTGVRTGCHYLICLSLCLHVCACVTYVVFYEARPKERSDRGHFLPLGEKPLHTEGAYRVPLFN